MPSQACPSPGRFSSGVFNRGSSAAASGRGYNVSFDGAAGHEDADDEQHPLLPDPQLRSDNLDEIGSIAESQFAEDEAVSNEQLQMIKARTMFQMVEEIEGGTAEASRKMLFLSNAQADYLCSSPDSLKKSEARERWTRPQYNPSALAPTGRPPCPRSARCSRDSKTEAGH